MLLWLDLNDTNALKPTFPPSQLASYICVFAMFNETSVNRRKQPSREALHS